jgi:cytochrome c-type biogenesis protein CcmE
MVIVGLAMLGVGIAVGFALRALNENLNLFYSPSQIAAGEAPAGRKIRLGGLVTKGSLHRETGQLEVRFDVTDTKKTTTVSYSGVLPDLFREGQGIIAYGVLAPDGSFRADEVLAKHDENYMPPEVADALKAQGHPGTVGNTGG